METTKGIEHCPFCNQDTEVGSIEIAGLIAIKLCSKCYTCWEVFRGKTDKLIRSKYYTMGNKVVENAETNEEALLCPMCWRKLEEDWVNWSVKCPDPICGYVKRLPGLSLAQRGMKSEYFALRNEIFELANGGKPVPA